MALAGAIRSWRSRQRRSMVIMISPLPRWLDGDDGASGSAGAVVTGETLARGRALGLDAADYLARNDSATYLRQVGGLLVTGPTQTNVADLYCVLKS
ncbi:MAG: MOFRL family protein [Chloroflexia bacterium]